MTDTLALAEPGAPPPHTRASARSAAVRLFASLALALSAIGVALIAQRLLAERVLPLDGVLLYALALFLWFRALALARLGDVEPTGWTASPLADGPRLASPGYAPFALGFAALAWLLLERESFTRGGVLAWAASLIFLWLAVAGSPRAHLASLSATVLRLCTRGVRIQLSPAVLALSAVLLAAVFFRFHQLPSAPAEMTSDHVEKLMDVRDVLQGKAPLFFPRNTGREPFQFYLSASLAAVVGLRHLALQLGTIAASLLAVVATYFLGKELLSHRFGLVAAALMAVSRWDVTLARMGLRFSFTTLFTALSLLFFLRALRTQQAREYLLCGLCLGLGLIGYSNFRVVPLLLVVLSVLGLLLAGGPSFRQARNILSGLVLTFGAAALVILPMARFVISRQDLFWARALSRVAAPGRGLPPDPMGIFLDNVKNALLMFNWRGDVGWVHNVNQAPALDQVTGALFALGVGYLIVRFLRRAEYWVGALLLSIPVLLLPSALSIAFPIENPSFNRASGAIPVVYFVAAVVPVIVWTLMRAALPRTTGAIAGAVLLAGLVLTSFAQNFDTYFGDFARQYRQSVPNSSEIAAVAAGYADALGGRDRVFILSYPHWVDHRAVGLHMGDITWNNVLMQPDQLEQQRTTPGGKVYLVHPMDSRGLSDLKRLYPNGHQLRHTSAVPGKDFLIYLVVDGA